MSIVALDIIGASPAHTIAEIHKRMDKGGNLGDILKALDNEGYDMEEFV